MGQANENYYRFIDSADIHIDHNTEKALSFLDSIPKPLERNIEGRLSEYYSIKTLIFDEYNEYSKMQQSIIFALKYADKEENYQIAGDACLNLFSNLYFVSKDTTAHSYLNKAIEYYEKCNYVNGLLEVQQMRAYAEFLDHDYLSCINLLLGNLDKFSKVEDNQYFNLFANYLLSSSYFRLGKYDKAHIYFNKLKDLQNALGVTDYNYYSFESTLKMQLAKLHFKSNTLDSTLYYLKASKKFTSYMPENILKDYYRLYADIYKVSGDINNSKAYIDTLMQIGKKSYKSNVEASILINDSLLKAETELAETKQNNMFSIGLIIIFSGVLVVLSLFYFSFYKNRKVRIIEQGKESSNFSYLKSNNERLAVKVHGLEEYIKNLKSEIREISSTKNTETQKERIKSLYKNLHIDSSTLLDKTENHLELVNDLNIEFFKQIEERYPSLNKSEVIICYYLFMGFSNKEIAVFLNVSVRSVESRRYRISKKMDFNKDETTLVNHLQETFGSI
ncbi:LuxR C-terminal-related transcriptional regulator [Flavobacteriaceae bacterium SZ-1-7]|uniref:tetratricopeptide repeat protein n=1 Tax=Tamlana sedimenti TaxID=3134126 RepID=UPI0031239916